MRRNIFTSYVICNRLNLEAFFEPIIDFIEIGKPRGPPPENRI
ncbi:ribosomal protein S7p/S5e containing protein [Corchorus olitorius]|uniref:Ribosomal protein S7p/S5e containing protein n=1 Tax=Corchorus olitorius TaxID=93759 RepID=A0A1R3KZJ4_9ROSI|nr:ribosomal protein S7p/S5e containing protein [Corchorus olitorius]OMP14010.1 ribosomal protein S7p/S5e containing protein [Corchorus olitorius]